jgi:hypothetical protein
MYAYTVTVDGEPVHTGDDLEHARRMAGVNIRDKGATGGAIWTNGAELVESARLVSGALELTPAEPGET